MIVKLQRPLYSTDPNDPWLAYTRDRRLQWLIPESELPAGAIAAMGDDRKGYFEAKLGTVPGELVIGDRVAAQPW